MSEPTYNGKTYEYFTLENKGEGNIVLYGWGTYGPNSVLAGQASKQFLTTFDTMEEAELSYPDVNYSNQYMEPTISLNHLSDREGSY